MKRLYIPDKTRTVVIKEKASVLLCVALISALYSYSLITFQLSTHFQRPEGSYYVYCFLESAHFSGKPNFLPRHPVLRTKQCLLKCPYDLTLTHSAPHAPLWGRSASAYGTPTLPVFSSHPGGGNVQSCGLEVGV